MIDSSLIYRKLLKHEVQGFKQARVLITGGTGLVGGYLAASLAHSCYLHNISLDGPIVVTGNGNSHFLSHLISRGLVSVDAIQTLVSNKKQQKFTHTFHAASPASPTSFSNAGELRYLNEEIIPNLLEITTKSFVFISTGEVYGESHLKEFHEEYSGFINTQLQRAIYPLTKRAGENLLLDLQNQTDTSVSIVRLFHSFGPGIRKSDTRSFAQFFYQALEGNQITLYSDGSQIRTFLHLFDVVRGLLFIAQKRRQDSRVIFNLGSSEPISILEFASRIKDVTGAKLLTGVGNKDYVSSPNVSIVPNIERISSFGWQQKITLNATIVDVWRWLSLKDRLF